jgi:hypothetical protein
MSYHTAESAEEKAVEHNSTIFSQMESSHLSQIAEQTTIVRAQV